jgi:hypothetical protein
MPPVRPINRIQPTLLRGQTGNEPIAWYSGTVRKFLVTLAPALGTLFTLAGCGSSGPSPSGLPSVKFVGNSTCATAGATPYSPSPPRVNSMPPVGQAINEMPHTHVQQGMTVQYDHNPPTSGCHYNLGYGTAPIQTGAYDREIAAEFWVHNLEHGYIAVLYNCPSGCSTEFQKLRTWYKGLPKDPEGLVPYPKVIILPWSTMTVPFAAVSWDWYDPIPNFSIAEVQRFYANHAGHAPESRAV